MVETLIEFFKDYGYWGMGILAFLSGTVVPIASEALLLIFLGLGMNAVGITLVATLGNTLGGITCFMLGSLASKEWLMRFFKIPEKRMKRADKLIQKYGYWTASISFVPALGETLLVMLGIMRVDKTKVIVVMAIGKLIRYALITATFLGVSDHFGF
ncbi:MAG: DedA family protein [Bacteroidaceae bacterium]|jgi:membrane protein YqaA with SNARE-associated domain|nr:DedA family protein [Bacteroidaceae bacterium]